MSKDSPHDSTQLAPAGGLEHLHAGLGFSQRSDLTYQSIEGIKLSHLSVHMSLFTGSILRGCTFESVDFSRCDMDGMLVEDCTFIDCDLGASDIRSCAFLRTVFNRTSLANAFISDCSFSGVRFDCSSLQGVIGVECTFVDCLLLSTIVARGSFTQNRFRGSHFQDMVLGDCTFLYNVMSRCTFEDSKIAAEAVGMTYGLTRDDMERLRFVYLGQDEVLPPDVDPIPRLVAEYHRRRWKLGVAVMNINFGIRSTVSSLREYLVALRESSMKGVVIKRDDLLFLATILEEMAADEALPLMSCVDVIETLSRIADHVEANPRPDSAHTSSTLHLVTSKLILIMDSMIERFEAQRIQLDSGSGDESVHITFTLREEPGTSVAGLLTELGSVSGFPIIHASETKEIRIGSYEEWVFTTLFSALSFQMFLYLVNGCVLRIAELKANVELLRRKEAPPSHMRSALQPRRSPPEFLLLPMRNLLAHAASMESFDDAKLNGFSKSNVLVAQRGKPVRKHHAPCHEEK